jgi:hypothetical protein
MKTVILLVMSLLLASTAQAAMSQKGCPPDTLWNSSTGECYLDPNSETAKRELKEQELREQERKCIEAQKSAEEYRQYIEKGMATSDLNPKLPPIPTPPECIKTIR